MINLQAKLRPNYCFYDSVSYNALIVHSDRPKIEVRHLLDSDGTGHNLERRDDTVLLSPIAHSNSIQQPAEKDYSNLSTFRRMRENS